jgi:hypothetical protein
MSALVLQLAFRASFSDYTEKKVIDHVNGKTTFTLVTPVYMALCTTVPTDADTGSTIIEANYTGYARKSIANTDWNAASGTTAAATNAAAIIFAACTAGTSTIIGFAICDAATVGNVLYWGTVTSKVIDVTSTPAQVAIGGLSLGLD